MTKPGLHLREGNDQYCYACGHDFLGLNGQRCPACGRPADLLSRRRRTARGASGRLLAVGIVSLGVILALVGLKFRKFESTPAGRATTKPDGSAPAQTPKPLATAATVTTAPSGAAGR